MQAELFGVWRTIPDRFVDRRYIWTSRFSDFDSLLKFYSAILWFNYFSLGILFRVFRGSTCPRNLISTNKNVEVSENRWKFQKTIRMFLVKKIKIHKFTTPRNCHFIKKEQTSKKQNKTKKTPRKLRPLTINEMTIIRMSFNLYNMATCYRILGTKCRLHSVVSSHV